MKSTKIRIVAWPRLLRGYRYFVAGRHLFYYKLSSQEIRVTAILPGVCCKRIITASWTMRRSVTTRSTLPSPYFFGNGMASPKLIDPPPSLT